MVPTALGRAAARSPRSRLAPVDRRRDQAIMRRRESCRWAAAAAVAERRAAPRAKLAAPFKPQPTSTFGDKETHEPAHGRFHRRWRGVGGRRARQPAHRKRALSRAAAGGRRRDASAVARAHQLRQVHQPPGRQLALCLRARGRHRRARHPGAARAHARRLERHQRHGVGARPAPGLRPLGAARKPRLELPGRAADLQEHGELRGRRRRNPRPRGAAQGLRHRRERPAVRQLLRGRRDRRAQAQSRLQRRRSGRHRHDAGLDQPAAGA